MKETRFTVFVLGIDLIQLYFRNLLI